MKYKSLKIISFFTVFNLLILLNCSSIRQNVYSQKEYTKVIINKIDSSNTFYIVYFKDISKKRMGIVTIPIRCETDENKEKIKINKKYSLKLSQESIAAGSENEYVEQKVDGKKVWDSNMKNIDFYIDCINMCGLYIKF